jgi:conjugal transfer pilin signal peptidase TrbI
MEVFSGTPGPAVLGTSSALKAWIARRGADQRALWTHFRRRWYVYLPLVLAWNVAQHYLLFNWTRSLPYSVVWLDPTFTFARGDLIVYRFDGAELMHLKKGQRFFKRIVGVPGDRVSVEDRRVLVNGTDVGIAKRYTLDGHRLEPLAPGVVPPGYLYVQGTHEMSFDSRYRESGLVHVSQIIGKVHVIF